MDISKIPSAHAASDDVNAVIEEKTAALARTSTVSRVGLGADDGDLTPEQRALKAKIKAALRSLMMASDIVPRHIFEKVVRAVETGSVLSLAPLDHLTMHRALKAAGLRLDLALLGVPRVQHEAGHPEEEYEMARAGIIPSEER